MVNIVPQNGMILLNGDDSNCIEVARECLAPLVEVGFSENCAERIREVSYSATGSRFSLGELTFDSPLFGEFNVRNAAMAVIAARFYGVTPEIIQTALTSFEGIARRPVPEKAMEWAFRSGLAVLRRTAYSRFPAYSPRWSPR